MNQNTLKKLGYYDIIEKFANYLYSEENRKNIKKISPFDLIEKANKELELTERFYKIIEVDQFPLSKFSDLNKIFSTLKIEGNFLQPKEFLKLCEFLEIVKETKKFIEQLSDEHYIVKLKFLPNLEDFSYLILSIRKTFDEKGEFLDSASFELKRIRNEIKACREQINEKLHNFLYSGKYDKILQDKFVTIRNNRYVLPFKLNFAQKVKGIIQDYSQTRETVFVEPEFIVQLNNKLAYLYQEEYNEKIRILHELSEIARSSLTEIVNSYKNLLRIDFLNAKARFGKFMNARCIYLNENELKIYSALNPILIFTKENVVPVDIIFENKKILMVSGANTGGKTVSLKTLGLIIALAQSGFMVPVREDSKIRFFKKLFVEIGDEQNILLDLSSFSAHIENIKSFIEDCDDQTLVLIDELGSGTDPQDGAAIGRAIIEYLIKRKTYAMITTHIHELKYLNYIYPEVENVAVDFDEKLLIPRYKLIYGIAGKSYGIDIAEKLKFPKEIIELAKKYRETKQEEVAKIIKNIEELKKQLLEKEKNYILAKQQAEIEKEKFKKLREKLLKEKESIKKSIELKYKKKMEKLLDEVENLHNKIKSMLSAKELAQLAKEKIKIIEQYSSATKEKKETLSPTLKIEDIFIGQKVKLKRTNSRGKILNVNQEKNEVEILLENNLKITVPIAELSPMVEEEKSKNIVINVSKLTNFNTINLIGKTVDEAIEELDRFLDKAIINGEEKIEIIHGIGSGKLKKGIWEYLKEKNFVKKFYLAENEPGGIGKTIVELK